jgi:hypothetical protein
MSVTETGQSRLVRAALRCYPGRWRRRHADEAADLAALLIRDGAPAASIAWNYLVGAGRAWLTPRPGRPLSTVAAALLAVTCLVGFSAALIAETVPARAASTTQPASSPKPARPSAGAGSGRRFTACRPAVPRLAAGAGAAAGHTVVQGAARAGSC